MPETEQQDKTLSETVVKEAVGLGMESPLRDSILEAVEEADGSTSGGGSSLPLAGVLFGLGAVAGFLAGRQSPELEETSLEDIQEPEIIEDVEEQIGGGESSGMTETESEPDTETETEPADGGSSRLPKLLLAIGAVAVAVVLRRRFAGKTENEWEPIEEFEPATGEDTEDEGGDGAETEFDAEAGEEADEEIEEEE